MIPTLRTARLILSAFTPADAPLVQRYAGDARIAATTAFVPHPYPDGAAGKWIATHLPETLEKKNITFAIRTRDEALCGAINLKLNLEEGLGEIGYWVAVPFWNQGLCTEAARRVIQYGFEEWKLEKIRAHHFVENPASGRVMEKAGMKHIGVIPRSLSKNGRLIDTAQYVILKAAFRAV